jgi:hypothetical protein
LKKIGVSAINRLTCGAHEQGADPLELVLALVVLLDLDLKIRDDLDMRPLLPVVPVPAAPTEPRSIPPPPPPTLEEDLDFCITGFELEEEEETRLVLTVLVESTKGRDICPFCGTFDPNPNPEDPCCPLPLLEPTRLNIPPPQPDPKPKLLLPISRSELRKKP